MGLSFALCRGIPFKCAKPTDLLSTHKHVSFQVYLLGGSIPERENDKLFNTSTFWSPDGSLLAKFRKIHLFDIDVPGKITFKVGYVNAKIIIATDY